MQGTSVFLETEDGNSYRTVYSGKLFYFSFSMFVRMKRITDSDLIIMTA